MEEYVTRAVLTASVGQYVAAFKEAKNAYVDYNRSVKNSSKGSTEALAGSSSVVSKAMKVSAAAVTGLGVAALKTGADFEHQMSRVGAISGATGGELKKMNNQAIQLGADTAFSAKEAAAGMENLASAGMKPKQIMEAMPGVLNLAAVSGGNVADSAENAATALNGFGLEASDSAHVADVFARAAADTNAEAGDMGEALKMVAPQAHSAGLSLEETAAAIGVLSDAGIKGSMAGSNLGMALTKVQNPSKDAKEAMSNLGFTAYDSAGKMKPLATQVAELKQKMTGMTDQEKQYNLSQIYGVQGGRAMNVLLDAKSGKLEKLTSSLKNSDGAAAKMAKTMQNDLSSSVEQFFGGLESMGIAIEETFSGSLKSGVDSITDSMGKLTKYIQDNQSQIQGFSKNIIDSVAGLKEFAPSVDQVGTALKIVLPSFLALEGFKGLGVGGANMIKALETMQNDLTLVQTGVRMVGSTSNQMFKVALLPLKTFNSTIKKTFVNMNQFTNALSSPNPQIFTGSIKKMTTAITGIPGKAKSAGAALINFTQKPTSMIDGINTKMFNFLKTVGATDSQVAALTNTAMKDGKAVGTIGDGAKRASDGLAEGAIGAGGLGSSLGMLLPIAAAVAVVAGAIYLAWDSNFGNIQGVVKSAMTSVSGMIDSMKPAISGISESLKPVLNILGAILKVVGVSAITAIIASIMTLVTAIRMIVDVLSAVSKSFLAVGYYAEGAFQKMTPGGKDGSEAFEKAKKSIDSAGKSLKDVKTAAVDFGKSGVKAVSEFGNSTDKAKGKSKTFSVSVKDLGTAAKSMKADFENSKTKLADIINTDGVSEKTKGFLTDVNNTLDDYQKSADKASTKFNAEMKKAEAKNGKDKLAAINSANAQLASATQENGKKLIAISGDLDRQLSTQRFSDGTKMTADQVTTLTDQNNKIKEKLIEQNQIFVQSQLSRVQNGKALNETQKQATITTLQANYALEAQQVTVGENKIAQLKQQIAQAKDQTTKAQLQQQLVQQQQHNQSLMNQEKTFGQQMNMTIANGSKLNYQTWSQGLANMKNVTTPQLQSMFLSFVQMNNNTGQQMQAFAQMLQQTGVKGVNGLVGALRDGKLTANEAAKFMSKDAIAGLQTLPSDMFKKGDGGKTKFITALKKGNFKAAGKYLSDQSASGASNTSKHEKAGKDNGKAHSKGIKSTAPDNKKSGKSIDDAAVKGESSNKSKHTKAGKENGKAHSNALKSTASDNKNSGKSISKAGASGIKSEKSSYSSAGKSNGKSYVSGIKSNAGSAKSAGRALAQNAKSGASGISLHSVGAQLANGVAAGIRNNAGSAIYAMRSLVNQVNAEARRVAKIHSPSRLMRDEVGKYLSLGIAVGIDEHAKEATKSMRNLMTGLNDQTENSQLGFNFNASSPNVATPNATNVSRGNIMTPVFDAISNLRSNSTSNSSQPAFINLNLGGKNYRAFVGDITHQQNVDLTIEEKYKL